MKILPALLTASLVMLIAAHAAAEDGHSGLPIATPPAPVAVMNGTSESLFHRYPGAGWERADGSYDAPTSKTGPTLKVSRVEKLNTAQCANTQNDTECNTAIAGYATAVPASEMQNTGVMGAALGYQTAKGADAVGVIGYGRIVGEGRNIATGGYFEGRADSSFARAIGTEIRSNNLTGKDPVDNVADGQGFYSVLASCGAGTWKSWKCNSAIQVTNAGNQFYNGIVVTDGSTRDVAFYDASYATTSVKIGGRHTHQIFGRDFYVAGSGHVWIGDKYDPDTANGLTVLQTGSNQAYFGSTGKNGAFVNIDAQDGRQEAVVQFDDAGLPKWKLGKRANNDFVLIDNVSGAPVLTITSKGKIVIGAGQNVTVYPDGTVEAAAGFKTGSRKGVTCAPGTVNLSTLTITDGIVTHC